MASWVRNPAPEAGPATLGGTYDNVLYRMYAEISCNRKRGGNTLTHS